jgi:diguanylate cyclase (GGDEF)-like protein
LLLDIMMPGISGFDILRRMRANPILTLIPVIVLTSAADHEIKLQALELGAADFLAKPVDPSELVLRLRNSLAAKAYRDRLAYSDPVTGLPNRRMFLDRLDWALEHCRRYRHQGAVLYIDLDRFKSLNEALGPGLGDSVLKSVGERLEHCVRSSDFVARVGKGKSIPSLSRLGSDEFTVLLPEVGNPEAAARVAQRLLEALQPSLNAGGHEVFVSASIGIATFPADGDDIDSLLRNAAAALHHAREISSANYAFYSRDLNARALQRLSTEGQLRRGLEREEFRLHYQPKVDAHSGRMVGAEGLLRWQHPERGLIGPGEFISMAESSGLIGPLGEWVLKQACEQATAWQASGLLIPRVAVNVSSRQFADPTFVPRVHGALAWSGLSPAHLVLELTESMVMRNPLEAVRALHQLKEIGVKLSLDDFGTGYSSLSYLKRFPLDELKIDRSFLGRIDVDPDDAAIVIAIIALARSLGLSTVAEGVETLQQLEFLRSEGCDDIQGYLFGKPMPAEEFALLLGPNSLPVLSARSWV